MSRDRLHPTMMREAFAVLDVQAGRIIQATSVACMGSYSCDFCCSQDGMEAWGRELVLIARGWRGIPLPQLYQFTQYDEPRPLAQHEDLFAPCCACNRGGHVDGERYVKVSAAELEQWLKEEL